MDRVSYTIQITPTWGGGAWRPSYLARVAGLKRSAARVQLELLGDDAFAVHVDCHPPYRRQGMVSTMVDLAVKEMAVEGRRLIFEDEREYIEKGGAGMFSDDGQAWADAYRLKRGIPLPPTVSARWMGHGRLAPREQVAA